MSVWTVMAKSTAAHIKFEESVGHTLTDEQRAALTELLNAYNSEGDWFIRRISDLEKKLDEAEEVSIAAWMVCGGCVLFFLYHLIMWVMS